MTTATGATGGDCPAGGGTTTASVFDTADRLIADGRVYDAFGRATRIPGSTLAFHANDLARSQTAGTRRQTWESDTAGRFRSWIVESNTTGERTRTSSKVNHYDGDGDSPRWIVENTSSGALTRNWRAPTGTWPPPPQRRVGRSCTCPPSTATPRSSSPSTTPTRSRSSTPTSTGTPPRVPRPGTPGSARNNAPPRPPPGSPLMGPKSAGLRRGSASRDRQVRTELSRPRRSRGPGVLPVTGAGNGPDPTDSPIGFGPAGPTFHRVLVVVRVCKPAVLLLTDPGPGEGTSIVRTSAFLLASHGGLITVIAIAVRVPGRDRPVLPPRKPPDGVRRGQDRRCRRTQSTVRGRTSSR